MRPVSVRVCPPSGGSVGLPLVLCPWGRAAAVESPLVRSRVGLLAAYIACTSQPGVIEGPGWLRQGANKGLGGRPTACSLYLSSRGRCDQGPRRVLDRVGNSSQGV